MKKLLLILLLFISLVSQAQMTVETKLGETIYGNSVNLKIYHPKNHSDWYVIFFHGAGERGPADGSRIDLVDKLGLPFHAKNGFEYPFHIVVPQCVNSFAILKHIMPAYVKLHFGAKVIIVTGNSLGGAATLDAKQFDVDNLIYAIAPVCGAGNSLKINNVSVPFSELIKKWPETNAWAFHGDADKTVSYKTAKTAIDAYNATHTKQFKLTTYFGGGHSAWTKAYSIKPGEDELLQWINLMFETAPKESGGDDLKNDVEIFLQLIQRRINELEIGVHHLDSAIHK